jgi:hypothetical protein
MKRTIKQNIYGNWVGYTGRSRAEEFGRYEIAAAYWLITGKVDFFAGYAPEWFAECNQALKQSFVSKHKRVKPTQIWDYNAPINPFFRGAERPRLGEDY